jgi:hypothetical protein
LRLVEIARMITPRKMNLQSLKRDNSRTK